PSLWPIAGLTVQTGRGKVQTAIALHPSGTLYDTHFVNIKIGLNGSSFCDHPLFLNIRRSMRRTRGLTGCLIHRGTGSDPSVTDYVLESQAKCQNCKRGIFEKTLVEPA